MPDLQAPRRGIDLYPKTGFRPESTYQGSDLRSQGSRAPQGDPASRAVVTDLVDRVPTCTKDRVPTCAQAGFPMATTQAASTALTTPLPQLPGPHPTLRPALPPLAYPPIF